MKHTILPITNFLLQLFFRNLLHDLLSALYVVWYFKPKLDFSFVGHNKTQTQVDCLYRESVLDSHIEVIFGFLFINIHNFTGVKLMDLV